MTLTKSLAALGLALALTACQSASASRAQLSAAPAAVVTPAPPASPSPTPTPTPASLTLVTMGASDVSGLGADDPATEGWAPVLATALTGKADHVRLGFPGWTAKQIRANVLTKAVQAQPDLVVIWTGVNDMNAGVSVSAFETELDAILAALAKTEARVYVLNMPDVHRLPAFKAQSATIAPALPLWRTAIQMTADRHGARVVALTPYSDEFEAHPELISQDGFHPSTRGYQRLAAIIQAAVQPAP